MRQLESIHIAERSQSWSGIFDLVEMTLPISCYEIAKV
jgi:hypothetical protein